MSVAGKDVGSAPGEVRLPAGRHELLVTAPRYLPFKATVDIDGMEQRQLLTAKLVAAWAPVTVLTEPTGATVFVDGTARGATPVKLELDAGTHRIELRQAGFKHWVTDLQVVANQPQTLGPVRLGLPDGTLVVRTDPVGASVSVGGAFRGRSPVTLDVRPDVALALVASREGYEPGTMQSTVGPGERREVQLSLQPIFGEVTVMAERRPPRCSPTAVRSANPGSPSGCQPRAQTSKCGSQGSALIERPSRRAPACRRC